MGKSGFSIGRKPSMSAKVKPTARPSRYEIPTSGTVRVRAQSTGSMQTRPTSSGYHEHIDPVRRENNHLYVGRPDYSQQRPHLPGSGSIHVDTTPTRHSGSYSSGNSPVSPKASLSRAGQRYTPHGSRPSTPPAGEYHYSSHGPNSAQPSPNSPLRTPTLEQLKRAGKVLGQGLGAGLDYGERVVEFTTKSYDLVDRFHGMGSQQPAENPSGVAHPPAASTTDTTATVPAGNAAPPVSSSGPVNYTYPTPSPVTQEYSSYYSAAPVYRPDPGRSTSMGVGVEAKYGSSNFSQAMPSPGLSPALTQGASPTVQSPFFAAGMPSPTFPNAVPTAGVSPNLPTSNLVRTSSATSTSQGVQQPQSQPQPQSQQQQQQQQQPLPHQGPMAKHCETWIQRMHAVTQEKADRWDEQNAADYKALQDRVDALFEEFAVKFWRLPGTVDNTGSGTQI